MKIDNLSIFWKILYYTWCLKSVIKKHKDLQLDIRHTKIRILHPLWFIIFIFTILIIMWAEWIFWLKKELKQFTII
jgi:hypothetical protein